MSTLRSFGRSTVLCAAWAGVAIVLGSSAAASAETLKPWFHLEATSRPGNLQPALARSTEEVITSTGVFELADEPRSSAIPLGVFATEPYFKEKAGTVPRATASNVQKALEKAYGPDDVEVTGGTNGEPPLTVKIADRAVPPEELKVDPMEGTAHVELLSEGRADGYLVVTAVNVGDASANGEVTPIKLTDNLPPHVRPRFMKGLVRAQGSGVFGIAQCDVTTLTCTFTEGCQGPPECDTGEEKKGVIPPFFQLEVEIGVEIEAGVESGELNEATISGGGAQAATVRHPITVSGGPTPLRVEELEQTPEEVGGSVDTQAGSHPFQFTTTFNLSSAIDVVEGHEEPTPAVLPKDVDVRLPPGLIGDPTAYPRCALAQFAKRQCGADTVLGVASVAFYEPNTGGVNTSTVPIFNLEPAVGEPARFGFAPGNVPVFLDTSVRTGEDYGVTVRAENVPQTVGFLSNTVTFWGVPGDSRHDGARGYGCVEALAEESAQHIAEKGFAACSPVGENNPAAFLSLPTSCPLNPLTGEPEPLRTSAEVDSWTDPGGFVSYEPSALELMPAMDGCGALPFSAEIRTALDSGAASSPAGLRTDVHVPQAELSNANGLAPANVRNISVLLPAALQVNSAAAGGLGVCTLAEIGLKGTNAASGVLEFTPSEASCPESSKIANVKVKTPVLEEPLSGAVYLAAPQNFAGSPENPFSSLIAMYVVAKDPVSGVLVKLPMKVSLNETTGQVTVAVDNSPETPFEDAEFEFFDGPRASLASPAHCGAYTTNATFEPWSNTRASHEALQSDSVFEITTGPGSAPCPGPTLPFAPAVSSQTLSVGAGAFTPLATSVSRGDGQQALGSVALRYPEGLAGVLTGVKLCGEAQANAGTCGPESMIGESTTAVGVGSDPYTVTGGKVYLTEKYDGAPFGLSIVTPAQAGPFVLQEGRPVIVRAKVEINPRTSVLTVSSGPIPTIIEGIPLQIQHVNVTITRGGFTFNPANCEKTGITGSAIGAEGASASATVPFQVANCQDLKFTPTLAVSTKAQASKVDGAELHFKISYPKGAMGTQAWFKELKIDFPKKLSSRLETLQRGCLAPTFEANPAACPAASRIGMMVVRTQVLPVPLTGPIYFVSYGGAKFPEAVTVLQGYGVTIELHGETFVDNKTGITSATFKSLPEVPFETAEVTLPTGRYSEFGANLPAKDYYNFCGQTLKMPTLFVGSNGVEVHQDTPVAITGCKNTLTRAQKLTAALKACRKKTHTKRAACEAQAKRRYARKTQKKK